MHDFRFTVGQLFEFQLVASDFSAKSISIGNLGKRSTVFSGAATDITCKQLIINAY